MGKGSAYVVPDDSKRKIVAGILRPGAMQPELRELPNLPRYIPPVSKRLQGRGPVVACSKAERVGLRPLDRQDHRGRRAVSGHRSGVDPTAPKAVRQDGSARCR